MGAKWRKPKCMDKPYFNPVDSLVVGDFLLVGPVMSDGSTKKTDKRAQTANSVARLASRAGGGDHTNHQGRRTQTAGQVEGQISGKKGFDSPRRQSGQGGQEDIWRGPLWT